MINLSSFSITPKRVLQILAAVTIVSILLILIFLQYTQKTISPASVSQNPPPQIPQDPKQQQPGAINIQAQFPPLPDELPTYEAETLSLPETSYKNIALNFGISSAPSYITDTTDGKQYNWLPQNVVLAVSQTKLRYENNNSLNPSTTNLSETELQNKALQFLEKISYLDKNIQLNPNETAYLNIQSGRYISASALSGAQFVQFKYYKDLSSYPLYFGPPSVAYTEIRLKKDGTVTFLNSMIFKDFTQARSYQLKDREVAEKELRSGQGRVVQTIIPDENGKAFELIRTQPFDMNTLTIKNITLGYYMEREVAKPIQPIFIFEGEFTNALNQSGKAYVYLPALTN